MFGENYKWNYDYARLALDSGFSFEKHRVDDFDKNKICLIDIDRVIQEKDVATIEKFIPCVVQFILDPEQAQILDDNFVKIFRMSQLAIDYLLFCKRYLDKTLVNVKEDFSKLLEENKELNLFVEDLKEHISLLMKEIKEKVSSFRCEHCNKVFSSEEFLNSHIKRRHSTPSNQLIEVETDKLHLEIKELKGRLNSAEKMIQNDQIHHKPVQEKEIEYESKKIDELQQKFEDLRVQVQSELKILQTQHNFQEKYEKLFEKMTLQNSRVQLDRGAGDLGRRRESTTQTDTEISQEPSIHFEVPKLEQKNKENLPDFDNTQKQISEFGEALEIKVTSSLQNIETQMQSFWNKLNEMEVHRKNYDESQMPPTKKPRSKYTVTGPQIKQENIIEEESSVPKKTLSKKFRKEENPQPMRGMETKFITDKEEFLNFQKKTLKKNQKKQNTYSKEVEEIRPQIKNLKEDGPKPVEEVKEITPLSTQGDNFDKATSSETSSETETASESSIKAPSKPASAKRRRPVMNSSKKIVVDDELFQHFKEEVEKIIIMGRLQDLGVSPEWKGLPTRSFQRALEIVNHQATLMKKTYPDFDAISAQIEREVSKKLQDITSRNKGLKKLLKETSTEDKRRKRRTNRVASPQIEIKNRKMYDTDSENEIVAVGKANESLKQFSLPYSAVIEELKSVTTKLEASDKSVSELNSVKDEEIAKNEDQTKGVLKNYPSVGSLTKKKVLFNLNNEDNLQLLNRDGGSTTSITSSVFDGTPRKKKENKIDKEKDIEDLSDFDFSDM